MKSWHRPDVPTVPGTGPIPTVYDSSTDELQSVGGDGPASLYVCGITPYDATHLGHAATYLAFDTLQRLWLDAGLEVHYVQNSTDVDDPLLERAARDGVDWRTLAAGQIDVFRGDMESLRILPPERYIAVTEVIDEIAAGVHDLLVSGVAYPVDSEDAAQDLYFDSAADSSPWFLGQESRLDRANMLELSAERGGDPARPGKRHPLDPLLWRSARAGEPSWETVLGAGRPGWHIECAVIALNHLPSPVTVNGGGSDLIFPHHEFSAGHAAALTGEPLAEVYAHAGMVAYQGEKMSKSLGNLVLVSELVRAGTDPRALRLALLSEHYRSDWEWTTEHLEIATARLAAWTRWAAEAVAGDGGVAELRTVLSFDLDTPAALKLIDARIDAALPASTDLVAAIDALLGIALAG
ncbi:cysteine--1-D-myo-inosityl 2-amino-2-deoxy-alpha-D-glucopyranoside ligase [Lacisediminihabitans changchengi]|uniref:L-cysteine:1D-myo-inositol 2-amino-2-deoxy-alpha-D-glucopyranoside ligase n=1 Tax=Lacisediminihabitans changchengi TaxID=2787634 RepID=A0A934STJ5_9MICO|nr:cysteine--1-D-myo-inosityl 2-amino-2-deoxy-alpha-D-glucopyranoside ligase [Lacisediminihabitans changchengi]MBK4347028.1 cysteine--1-D-myo-inosityl 2-amino-2-deoxy-alpha-D-glucopyranoside ligase [Lacisediminihabitans changchengi]MBK4347849.1 cysteine--1-D-myo-inosityl 2-amino-2-deoxy-alpha-D-glucopyranoside ligase [Lacisediminihabitans changchengi]